MRPSNTYKIWMSEDQMRAVITALSHALVADIFVDEEGETVDWQYEAADALLLRLERRFQ